MIGVAWSFARCAVVLALIAAASCASTDLQRAAPADATMPMRIELLGFPGCPNTSTMRTNLLSALSPDEKAAFHDVNQETLGPADQRRGWPTPTVLVDGHDLFGMPALQTPAMGCRIYPGGVPTARDLRAALDAVRTIR